MCNLKPYVPLHIRLVFQSCIDERQGLLFLMYNSCIYITLIHHLYSGATAADSLRDFQANIDYIIMSRTCPGKSVLTRNGRKAPGLYHHMEAGPQCQSHCGYISAHTVGFRMCGQPLQCRHTIHSNSIWHWKTRYVHTPIGPFQ